MVYTKDHFNARVGAVNKKLSRRGRNEIVARVDANGIVCTKAKRRSRGFPIKGLVLLVLLVLSFFCFKAFMLSANGPVVCEERLAVLQAGTAVEAAGARLLAIDPLTQFISDQTGPLLR